jgi:hypothetical protein
MLATTQICTRCEIEMFEDWNLAPVEINKIIIERNIERIYEKDVYLCDDCYDYWCTKHDIQPLERE